MKDTNTTSKLYVPVWEKYALTIYYERLSEHFDGLKIQHLIFCINLQCVI